MRAAPPALSLEIWSQAQPFTVRLTSTTGMRLFIASRRKGEVAAAAAAWELLGNPERARRLRAEAATPSRR